MCTRYIRGTCTVFDHVHVFYLLIKQPYTYFKNSNIYVGLARTVYIHRLWPYIWWFSCQKYRIHTVYIWFWPTLHICLVLAHPGSAISACTHRFAGCLDALTRAHRCLSLHKLQTSTCVMLFWGWLTPYMYNVQERMYANFPAKNTVYTPYVHTVYTHRMYICMCSSGQPYTCCGGQWASLTSAEYDDGR